MSQDARQWVWRHSKARRTALILLQRLAEDMGRDGTTWRAYSMDELAEMTRTSVRQTQYNIHWLIEKGELRAKMGNGRGDKSVYTLAAIADGWRLEKGASSDTERVQVAAQKGASSDTERVQVATERVQVATQKGASSDTEKPFKSTNKNTLNNQDPPPPLHEPASDGGGGLDFDDEETEALLIELQSITGRPPANYERSVLSIPEFARFRRRALLELRRDWVTVKQKSNTGWWLKRVIERLIEEHVRANAPLFPIDDAAAAERRRKYVREDDEELEHTTWVRPWETNRQDGAYH